MLRETSRRCEVVTESARWVQGAHDLPLNITPEQDAESVVVVSGPALPTVRRAGMCWHLVERILVLIGTSVNMGGTAEPGFVPWGKAFLLVARPGEGVCFKR